MKMSQGADHLRLVLKHDTALNLCLFQVIEGAKGAIGDAFIAEWPQAFTGLQFRGIGWQEEQMDALGHHQLLAGMPPSAIEHQQDPLAGTGSDRLSKVGKRDGEDLRRHGRQQKPFGLASGRLNKRVEVEPLVVYGLRTSRRACPCHIVTRQTSDVCKDELLTDDRRERDLRGSRL